MKQSIFIYTIILLSFLILLKPSKSDTNSLKLSSTDINDYVYKCKSTLDCTTFKPSINRTFLHVITKDSKHYKVEKTVVEMSGLIKSMITDCDQLSLCQVPLPNIEAAILDILLQYMFHFRPESIHTVTTIDKPLKSHVYKVLNEWEREYIYGYNGIIPYGNITDSEMDYEKNHNTMVSVLMGANFINLQELVNLGSAVFASMMIDKNATEIRELFDLENDFSEEENKRIEQEQKWIQELYG